jgi:DNA invertase Pin-like site-specific DNA recombinase
MSATSGNGNGAQLIDAAAYTRKSTKGEHATATGKRRERQEKSPEQQREEILKHARGRFRIVRWYEDEASGWKREKARPGFARMLADAREQADFKAIVADDADRFSRASYRKVLRDVDDLADAGVEVISCVNGGDFRIADETDAGEAHRLVAVAMANHEFSGKLSRRVTLARRNAAEEGKRTGGPRPRECRCHAHATFCGAVPPGAEAFPMRGRDAHASRLARAPASRGRSARGAGRGRTLALHRGRWTAGRRRLSRRGRRSSAPTARGSGRGRNAVFD